jgi:hypothetical protein
VKNGGFATHDGEIYEIHVEANDIKVAQHISNLIISSKAIIDSSMFLQLNNIDNNLQCSLNKALGGRPDIFIEARKVQSFEPEDGWYYACIIASRAFTDSHKENAVFKFQLAREICDVNPMELKPYYTEGYSSPFPYDHLKYAYVIVITYSVLEELGLEIRTNGEYSTIKDGKEWNPVVLENLKCRLNKKNISPDNKIPWVVRGNIKRPFKKNIDKTSYCEWSDKKSVSDFDISVVDAILELSYMRSKMSSHGVGERASDLAICDVENAYCLVRIILLNYFKIDMCYKER